MSSLIKNRLKIDDKTQKNNLGTLSRGQGIADADVLIPQFMVVQELFDTVEVLATPPASVTQIGKRYAFTNQVVGSFENGVYLLTSTGLMIDPLWQTLSENDMVLGLMVLAGTNASKKYKVTNVGLTFPLSVDVSIAEEVAGAPSALLFYKLVANRTFTDAEMPVGGMFQLFNADNTTYLDVTAIFPASVNAPEMIHNLIGTNPNQINLRVAESYLLFRASLTEIQVLARNQFIPESSKISRVEIAGDQAVNQIIYGANPNGFAEDRDLCVITNTSAGLINLTRQFDIMMMTYKGSFSNFSYVGNGSTANQLVLSPGATITIMLKAGGSGADFTVVSAFPVAASGGGSFASRNISRSANYNLATVNADEGFTLAIGDQLWIKNDSTITKIRLNGATFQDFEQLPAPTTTADTTRLYIAPLSILGLELIAANTFKVISYDAKPTTNTIKYSTIAMIAGFNTYSISTVLTDLANWVPIDGDEVVLQNNDGGGATIILNGTTYDNWEMCDLAIDGSNLPIPVKGVVRLQLKNGTWTVVDYESKASSGAQTYSVTIQTGDTTNVAIDTFLGSKSITAKAGDRVIISNNIDTSDFTNKTLLQPSSGTFLNSLINPMVFAFSQVLIPAWSNVTFLVTATDWVIESTTYQNQVIPVSGGVDINLASDNIVNLHSGLTPYNMLPIGSVISIAAVNSVIITNTGGVFAGSQILDRDGLNPLTSGLSLDNGATASLKKIDANTWQLLFVIAGSIGVSKTYHVTIPAIPFASTKYPAAAWNIDSYIRINYGSYPVSGDLVILYNNTSRITRYTSTNASKFTGSTGLGWLDSWSETAPTGLMIDAGGFVILKVDTTGAAPYDTNTTYSVVGRSNAHQYSPRLWKVSDLLALTNPGGTATAQTLNMAKIFDDSSTNTGNVEQVYKGKVFTFVNDDAARPFIIDLNYSGAAIGTFVNYKDYAEATSTLVQIPVGGLVTIQCVNYTQGNPAKADFAIVSIPNAKVGTTLTFIPTGFGSGIANLGPSAAVGSKPDITAQDFTGTNPQPIIFTKLRSATRVRITFAAEVAVITPGTYASKLICEDITNAKIYSMGFVNNVTAVGELLTRSFIIDLLPAGNNSFKFYAKYQGATGSTYLSLENVVINIEEIQ